MERYLCTKTGVKPNTLANYNFVQNLLKKETFSEKKISQIKTSDAKLFLIKLQQDGIYIFFHTGLRISEFCGLTLRDVH